ncbi:hypothetical protein GPECTOR_107g158 [Gonium pectorale]|uniref:Uncharacterized protein n=1 Tax=Gonium pectorale TaxID=33097 RepID=A0A150FZH3_GONPE|nr:hypothetical protein GPECTOR_107g158 [Gonium pectorale]|eukprot:KXZ43013.1 hypothetical protein GPECTOR_107g158 [Gonium pectorale]
MDDLSSSSTPAGSSDPEAAALNAVREAVKEDMCPVHLLDANGRYELREQHPVLCRGRGRGLLQPATAPAVPTPENFPLVRLHGPEDKFVENVSKESRWSVAKKIKMARFALRLRPPPRAPALAMLMYEHWLWAMKDSPALRQVKGAQDGGSGAAAAAVAGAGSSKLRRVYDRIIKANTPRQRIGLLAVLVADDWIAKGHLKQEDLDEHVIAEVPRDLEVEAADILLDDDAQQTRKRKAAPGESAERGSAPAKRPHVDSGSTAAAAAGATSMPTQREKAAPQQGGRGTGPSGGAAAGCDLANPIRTPDKEEQRRVRAPGAARQLAQQDGGGGGGGGAAAVKVPECETPAVSARSLTRAW